MAGRRRLGHDERRESILRVARELFSRRPYSAVSVAEIAAAAGVSPPLIVFYYGSKQALYLEVIRTAVGSISTGLQALPGPPSLDRLHAGVRFYAEYARAHREGFLSLLRGGTEPSIPEAAMLVETLRAEVSRQIVDDVSAVAAPPLDGAARVRLRVAVRGYLGYVEAALAHWLDLPDDERHQVEPDDVAELAVGAFTGALEAVTNPASQPRITRTEPVSADLLHNSAGPPPVS